MDDAVDATGVKMGKTVVAIAFIRGDGKGPHHRELSLEKIAVNIITPNDEEAVSGFKGEGDVTLKAVHSLSVHHVETELLRNHISSERRCLKNAGKLECCMRGGPMITSVSRY